MKLIFLHRIRYGADYFEALSAEAKELCNIFPNQGKTRLGLRKNQIDTLKKLGLEFVIQERGHDYKTI